MKRVRRRRCEAGRGKVVEDLMYVDYEVTDEEKGYPTSRKWGRGPYGGEIALE